MNEEAVAERKWVLSSLKQKLKATIVWLILEGEVEKALRLLARETGVEAPTIEVGLPKGRKRRALGCYEARRTTISVLDSDTLKDPFVVLHEFYHHLRTRGSTGHRGTEKYANDFAKEFIEAYNSIVLAETGND